MLGGRSIPLVRVFGIRIGVDPSWFLALFLFIWLLTGYYQDALPGNDDTGAFLLATASALLFFLSILLHELGHAWVAIRNRIPIAGIDLWLFGGIAKMTRDTPSPGVEFRVAIAGPVVTLLIAVACALIGMAAGGSTEFWDAMRGDPKQLANGLLAMLAYLTSINLVLLIFNLIPAFPLDGGRVARAIAWKVTGDRTRATNFTATIGQGFSYLMIGLGIAAIVGISVPFVGKGFIAGAWLVFLGTFLGQAAKGAAYQTALMSKIEGVRVADVMDNEPVAIPGDMTIDQALHEYFLRYRYPWFPVVDRNGRFVGIVDRERAERIPEDRQKVFTVREIIRGGEDSMRVRSDESLEALLGSEPLLKTGALMAVDADGRLLGVITWDQVRRAVQQGVAGVASR
jgi:Zn-dependent protease/predicted transcriptional regulator